MDAKVFFKISKNQVLSCGIQISQIIKVNKMGNLKPEFSLQRKKNDLRKLKEREFENTALIN